MDGWQYCTKTRWFTGNATVGYPAPFNKTFHLEVGLAVGGRPASWDSQEEEDDEYDPLSALPQEMLVDYVRISQVSFGGALVITHVIGIDRWPRTPTLQ